MHGKPIYVSREYNEPYSITNGDQAIIASECVPLSATTPYTHRNDAILEQESRLDELSAKAKIDKLLKII